MGDEISTSHFSKKDFTRFDSRMREETALLEKWFTQQRFADELPKGGFELEAWLVDRKCRPAPINEEFLEKAADTMVVPELSRFNVEFNGQPRTLNGAVFTAMCNELNATWERARNVAHSLDATVAMIGILPTVTEDELILANMSSMERFRALNEQVLRLRKGQPLHLDIQGCDELHTEHNDVMLESAATSFQIHFQMTQDLSMRIYNAAQVLSAPMVAVSANSPYLFGKDLWDETRVPLFEQAVSIRGDENINTAQRVSFGSGYVQNSIFECFQENRDIYPVLLPATLEDEPTRLPHVRLHNGTIWRWNRPLIGFDDNGVPHLRIEHRVVGAAPTVIDNIANAALFYGLVHSLSIQSTAPETELAFEQAKNNFYNAARYGLRAEITWINGEVIPIQKLLLEELIPTARQGLKKLGTEQEDIEHFLGIIEHRVTNMQNGAAWQRAYVARYGDNMHALTAAYMIHQKSGIPVHEWPIE